MSSNQCEEITNETKNFKDTKSNVDKNSNCNENKNKQDNENVSSKIVYIQVAENETEEPVELPCEEDNSILLSTVTSQFPGASGLKYRNPDTKTMRGLRLSEGKFLAPEKGWSAYCSYFCVFPREESIKGKKGNDAKNNVKCSDLIVLGLPWKITEDELKEYFEQFGETVMVQIKKDPKSGQSKGFGFVKFSDYDTQMRVVSKRHNISGRWCDVRIPLSKGEEQFNYQSSEFNRKIFVGRITEDFTCEDLRNYFKKFGDISDVFIPKPFRAFAFITFKDADTAQTLCGEDHLIKGVSVHVSNAVPKVDFNASGGYHHNNHNNHYGNHHYGSNHHHHHQSNYHNNSPRYNPYKGNMDQRRSRSNYNNNSNANNNMHNNGNPLVNSTYNHPMGAMSMSPNPIWTNSLGAHVAGNGSRTDLGGLSVSNPPNYGMNALPPPPQKHYGQH